MQSGKGQEGSWKAILFPDGRIQMGWLTLTLILLATAVTMLSGFKFDSPFSRKFFITQFVKIDGGIGWKNGREIERTKNRTLTGFAPATPY